MINERGLELIKRNEKLRLKAYLDNPNKGVWTIGYGHTGQEVHEGLEWSKKKANAQLEFDVLRFERGVLDACKREPNENQLAAMVCLAFNIGLGAFRNSTVLKMHNAGKWAEAANAFSMWKKDNGQVMAGLVRRRAEEAALYIDPTEDTDLSTNVVPQADDPASSRMSIASIATGASVAASAAQQTVANVSSVWDTINAWGIDPRIVMLALGAAGVLAFGWFVWDHYQRSRAGDR